MKKLKIKSGTILGWAFSLPALIYMLVFIGYPIIQNIILSFKNVNVYTFANKDAQNFIGFDNYIELFTDPNSVLLNSIVKTLIFTVGSIFFQFIIGFALALLFNKKFPGCSFFRGVTMISWLLPVTVSGLLFKFMFAASGGIINQFLVTFGAINKPIEWLLNPVTATVAIIIANIWVGIPFNMMLILTGLTTIPNEVYESASIDGANGIQKLFRITIPMIKSAIMSVLTLGFVYTFKVFDLVWVMTKGGPVNSTQLVSTYSYRLSFEEFQFSKGASAANILFIILLFVGLFYIQLIKEDEVM
ncbi:MAG TPA: sugar ABC transporter permease [Clostridiales bacterium]|nr:sugar ABC transporter permease [Clostridiales bacterium]